MNFKSLPLTLIIPLSLLSMPINAEINGFFPVPTDTANNRPVKETPKEPTRDGPTITPVKSPAFAWIDQMFCFLYPHECNGAPTKEELIIHVNPTVEPTVEPIVKPIVEPITDPELIEIEKLVDEATERSKGFSDPNYVYKPNDEGNENIAFAEPTDPGPEYNIIKQPTETDLKHEVESAAGENIANVEPGNPFKDLAEALLGPTKFEIEAARAAKAAKEAAEKAAKEKSQEENVASAEPINTPVIQTKPFRPGQVPIKPIKPIRIEEETVTNDTKREWDFAVDENIDAIMDQTATPTRERDQTTTSDTHREWALPEGNNKPPHIREETTASRTDREFDYAPMGMGNRAMYSTQTPPESAQLTTNTAAPVNVTAADTVDPDKIATMESEISTANTRANAAFTKATENKGDIDNNITNIELNDDDIQTNKEGIAVNQTSIDTNSGNIVTNDADIQTNLESIESNDADIQTNLESIESNDADIQTNLENIESNDTDIETNKNNIQANLDSIEDEKADIKKNKEDITTNKNGISSNFDYIKRVGTTAGNNADDVGFNYDNIAVNKQAIKINKDNIFDNTARIGAVEKSAISGIAISMATEVIPPAPGKKFSLSLSVAEYEGISALGVTGSGRVNDSTTLFFGYGTDSNNDHSAAKVGTNFQW